MAQAPLSLTNRRQDRFSAGRRGFGLKAKIAMTVAGTILVTGLTLSAMASYLMVRALRDQIDRRSLAVATNLSDAAAAHILAKYLLGLHAWVTKYALLDGVAYVYVEDRAGELITHSLGVFPPELREERSPDGIRQVQRRDVIFQGKAVYETRVPILEGQLGAVHVGFWRDAIEEEIRRALVVLIGFTAILLAAGVAFSVFMAQRTVRPIVRLTRIAENMTKGDLDTPLDVKSTGEIGELARSLERMRASLKAAMARLSRAAS